MNKLTLTETTRLSKRFPRPIKEIIKESIVISGLDLSPKDAVVRFMNGDLQAFNQAGIATWQKPSEYGKVNDVRFEDKLDALDAANKVTNMLENERNRVEKEQQLAAAAAAQEQQPAAGD